MVNIMVADHMARRLFRSVLAFARFYFVLLLSSVALIVIVLGIAVTTSTLFVWRKCSSTKSKYCARSKEEVINATEAEILNSFQKLHEDMNITSNILEFKLPERDISVSLHSLAARSSGQFQGRRTSRSLVLIHGVSSGALFYLHTLPFLLGLYQEIHLLNMPGFGRLPTPTFLTQAAGDTATNILAEIVESYILHYSLEKPDIFGHSFGGHVAATLAMRSGNISRVVLADPAGVFPLLGKYGTYWAIFFKLSILHRLLRFLQHLKIKDFIFYTWFDHLCYSANAYYWLEVFSRLDAVGDLFVASNIVVSWFYGRARWICPSLPKLLAVNVPIAVMYGEHDNIMPCHQGEHLSSLSGGSVPCVIVEQAGHSPQEEPAQFVQALSLAFSLAREPQIDYKGDGTTKVSDVVQQHLDNKKYYTNLSLGVSEYLIFDMYESIFLTCGLRKCCSNTHRVARAADT